MNGIFQITPAAARVNAGMNQEEAARKIGVTKATVVSWEKGKTIPDVDRAQRMADVYGVPMQFILFEKKVNNSLTDDEKGA